MQRSNDLAGLRQTRLPFRILNLGDAEVDDLGHPVRLHDHVGRLDVPMDDALFVGVTEGRANLLDDSELGDQVQLPARGDDLVQPFAFHILHGDEGQAILDAHLVDRRNIRVPQRGCLGFYLKTSQTIVERGLERPLDGHPAAKVFVLGKENFAHASAAENSDDLVLADLPSGDFVHSHDRAFVEAAEALPGNTIAAPLSKSGSTSHVAVASACWVALS